MSDARVFIPAELFAPAETSRFEGALRLPCLEAGFDRCRFREPLAWQVDVTNTGEALLVSGTVAGEAETECARCLDGFALPLAGEVEGYFLLDARDESPEDMDDDEFDVLPEDHVIDLEPLLKAALLLELPLVPLCGDDCRGLCPLCGADLNEGLCTCERNGEDGEGDAPAGPFSVLKDFPFEKE